MCSAAISASNSADGEELDFVDEEDDPGAVVGRGLAEGKEQVGQVRAEVAGVGLALDPFGVEPGAEGAGGVDGELEGAQHAGGAGGAVLPLRFRRQLQEGLAGQGHHPPAERHVLGDLGVDGGPVALGGVVFEPAEQHGLAHSAQPGEDHRAFGTAAFQPAEQDVEAVELLVAAHEQRWAGARVGRIRVLPRVHGHLLHELPGL